MVPDYSKNLRRLLADGKTLDETLAALGSNGVSIVGCIDAIRKFRQCTLVEAKEIVHFSPAWADVREQNEKWHCELEEIARQDADETTT